jgi:molybdopterin-guanine dinucleotide biosynthesis protein A
MPASAGNRTPEVAALRVAGLVLAGGEGRRMGGQDKGLLLLNGQPLVAHVLQRLVPQVGPVLISANRSLPAYQALGWPVRCDLAAMQGMGPLAGLASVAQTLPGEIDAIQLVPCDTPRIPPDLVARLSACLENTPDCLACYPYTPRGPEPGMLQVRLAALASLEGYLQQGGRSLRGWLSGLAARTVDFEQAEDFVNTNDPASLAALEQQLRSAEGQPGHDKDEARD